MPIVPLRLAMVLGRQIEEHLRVSLIASKNDITIFFTFKLHSLVICRWRRSNWYSLLSTLLLSFLSFSFVASSIYLFNDLLDLESDRKHHKKKSRPLANGNLSIPYACLLLFVLLTSSFLLAAMLPFKFLAIILIYFILNLLYTFQFKKQNVVFPSGIATSSWKKAARKIMFFNNINNLV